jgi:hypothetical protein
VRDSRSPRSSGSAGARALIGRLRAARWRAAPAMRGDAHPRVRSAACDAGYAAAVFVFVAACAWLLLHGCDAGRPAAPTTSTE